MPESGRYKCQQLADLSRSCTGEVAKSTDTQHANCQLRVHHPAQHVVHKHLDQRHVTCAALTNQLSTDQLVQYILSALTNQLSTDQLVQYILSALASTNSVSVRTAR